jgi:hypothetical protein
MTEATVDIPNDITTNISATKSSLVTVLSDHCLYNTYVGGPPHGIQEVVGASERDKADGYILNISRYVICKSYCKTLDLMDFHRKRSDAPHLSKEGRPWIFRLQTDR